MKFSEKSLDYDKKVRGCSYFKLFSGSESGAGEGSITILVFPGITESKTRGAQDGLI